MPGCMKLTVIVFELVVDPVTVVDISMVQRGLLSVGSNQPINVSGVLSGE